MYNQWTRGFQTYTYKRTFPKAGFICDWFGKMHGVILEKINVVLCCVPSSENIVNKNGSFQIHSMMFKSVNLFCVVFELCITREDHSHYNKDNNANDNRHYDSPRQHLLSASEVDLPEC